MKRISARQSPLGKRLWSNVAGKGDMSDGITFAPYFDPLIDLTERKLPTQGKVILLGGGIGTIAALFENGTRDFANLEVVGIPRPSIPTFLGDMEESIPIPREPDREHAILTPFSIEYTSIKLSTGVISNYLVSGERFITLSHHADSFVLVIDRKAVRLLELINQVIRLIDVAPEIPKPEIIVELSQMFDKITPAYYNVAMATIDILLASTTRTRKLSMLGELKEWICLQVELSKMSVAQEFRTPEQFAKFVDKRLRLVDGMICQELGVDTIVGAAFERV